MLKCVQFLFSLRSHSFSLLPKLPHMPQSILNLRLAYAGSAAMYVSWNTLSQLSNLTSQVWLGSRLHESICLIEYARHISTSLTYNNYVKITRLRPDTIHYYMPIGLPKVNLTSLHYTFRTSRPARDGTSYSVAVVVDIGTTGK